MFLCFPSCSISCITSSFSTKDKQSKRPANVRISRTCYLIWHLQIPHNQPANSSPTGKHLRISPWEVKLVVWYRSCQRDHYYFALNNRKVVAQPSATNPWSLVVASAFVNSCFLDPSCPFPCPTAVPDYQLWMRRARRSEDATLAVVVARSPRENNIICSRVMRWAPDYLCPFAKPTRSAVNEEAATVGLLIIVKRLYRHCCRRVSR